MATLTAPNPDPHAVLEGSELAGRVARAIEEIRKACTTDEAKAVWAAQGAEFPDITGPAFGQFVSAEVRKWAQVVKASGAKLE